MASLTRERAGTYVIQTSSLVDGRRRSFRLGRTTREYAEIFRDMTARLERAVKVGVRDTEAEYWANRLSPSFSKRFRECHLTKPTRGNGGDGYGIIYAIESVGLGAIKIGWTQGLWARALKLDEGVPIGEIQIIAVGRGFVADEKEIHRDLASYMIRKCRTSESRGREWFYATDRVREYIASHLRITSGDWVAIANAEDLSFEKECAERVSHSLLNDEDAA